MFEMRRVLRYVDRAERQSLEDRTQRIRREPFLDLAVRDEEDRKQQGKRYLSRLEIDTILSDAEESKYIDTNVFRNARGQAFQDTETIALLSKGRDVLKPFGLGWLYMLEYSLGQFKTIGAFTLGVVSLGILNVLILLGHLSWGALTRLHF